MNNASFELWGDLQECMSPLHKTELPCNSEIALRGNLNCSPPPTPYCTLTLLKPGASACLKFLSSNNPDNTNSRRPAVLENLPAASVVSLLHGVMPANLVQFL